MPDSATRFIEERPLTKKEFVETYRLLHEVIKSFLDLKCGVLATMPPSPCIVHEDGRMEMVSEPIAGEFAKVLQEIDDIQREATKGLMAKLARGYVE